MTGVRTVALVGCGAVTSIYYVPALRACSQKARIVSVFDPDPTRADDIARDFAGAEALPSFDAVLQSSPDLVILASPPLAHEQQAIAALQAGCDVLCEKPMAPTLGAARAMNAAAKATGRLLAVNMVRRHFPASKIVKRLAESGTLGAPRSVRAFEGGPFRWPIQAQSYFSRAVSGGGVLADIGSHVIDLLSWWVGVPVFESYADDAMGGVEANALLDLRWGDVPGSIRLSRDWARPSQIEIEFEHATVRWCNDDIDRVKVLLKDAPGPLMVVDDNAGSVLFEDCFARQIEASLDGTAGEMASSVTSEAALPTVELIEHAYGARTLLAMPWLEPDGGGHR